MPPTAELVVVESSPPPLLRRDRTALILAAVGVATYALALVATLPARAVVAGADAAGTVWHGEAALPAGAIARWDWSLARSLARGGLAGTWTLDGPGTMVAGGARWRPVAGLDLDDARGTVAWPLLAAVVPGLPTGCTIGVRIDLATVDLGRSRQGARGTAGTAAGVCPAPGPGATRAVPRLVATFAGTHAVIAPWTARTQTYATVTIDDNAVHLRTTPLGAAVLPGTGRAGDRAIGL